MEPFFAVDTAPNGRLVATGSSSGNIFISSYDLGENDDDKMTAAEARRERLKKQTTSVVTGSMVGSSIGNMVGSVTSSLVSSSAAAAAVNDN